MKRVFTLIGIALLGWGCTSQQGFDSNQDTLAHKGFKASIEGILSDGTRAHLEGLKVEFDNEDKIAVFDNNSAASQYTYSSETGEFAGTSSATGEEIEGVFALYPYSNDISLESGIIEGTLPATQTYESNSFPKNSHVMYAKTDEVGDELYFKNMVSYIRIHLYGEGITVRNIKLTTNEDTYISGDYYIETGDDNPSLIVYDYDESEHPQSSNSVILDCSAEEGGGVTLGDANNPTAFYIAVPAQTYSNGFSIVVSDIFGREFAKSASSPLALERNHIKPMSALEFVYDEEENVQIETDGDNAYVEPRPEHSLEDFLKWAYIVNNINNSLGIKLVGDVHLPKKEIAVDHEKQTYVYTDTNITIDANGVPSGSNWIPLRNDTGSAYYTDAIIDGNNYVIDGMIINQNSGYAGFIGLMYPNVTVKNLTFDKAYVYSTGSTVGIVAGYSRNGTLIDNVHITNSHIAGVGTIGGIVGQNYRQVKPGVNNSMAVISNCSIDSNSTVKATTSEVGGICGYNYGAAIVGCVNNADIEGTNNVGGIVGHSRSYYKGKVNGYVIACGSGADATITVTTSSGYVGGVIGYSLNDNSNHPDSHSYITACYSLANVEGQGHKGNLAGHAYGGNDVITASWAKIATDVSLFTAGSPTLHASEQYATSSDLTQEIVDEMNSAINTYNTTVDDVHASDSNVLNIIKCNYKWQYNADTWPTLVKTQN